MVNRQDIRNINEQVSEFIDALDELEELHEQSQRDGVSVSDSAYADAQERVKDAVAAIVNDSNDAVDRTDVLEDDDGNELVSLPNAALERKQSQSPPDSPSNT